MAVQGEPKNNNLTAENKVVSSPSKKKGKGFILLILLVVLLAGAGVIYFTGWGQGIFGRQPSQADAQEKPAYTYDLPEMVFNLTGGERRRFLSIKLSFGFREPGLAAELEQRMPEIRDALVSLMWGITEEQVREESSIEHMKKEIKGAANNILQTGEVTDVFFWHVMVQ